MAKPRPEAPDAAPKSRAMPPLYLLRAGEMCPHCGGANNVYTLAASGLYDHRADESYEDFLLLTYVEALPPRVLKLLANRCPNWRFDREADERPYLMNHCLHCSGTLSDDDLHGDIGGAFRPSSPDQCWNITQFTLPTTEEIRLACSWSGGLGDWLDFIKAKPWRAIPKAV